jgi:hypothetical protein
MIQASYEDLTVSPWSPQVSNETPLAPGCIFVHITSLYLIAAMSLARCKQMNVFS